MNALEQFLSRLTVIEGAAWGGLAVYPVVRTVRWKLLEKPGPVYTVLAEAIARQQAAVTEAPSAHVPELQVKNEGPAMVLGLEGDELVGGKQNRCLNASVLLEAGRVTLVPVSCVERRRWQTHGQGHDGFSMGHGMSHGLRRQSHGHVTEGLRRQHGHGGDQQAVWSHLEADIRRHGAHAPTSSMHDLIEARRGALDRYLEAFPYYPNAVGMVVAVGMQIAGADLFDTPDTARHYWPRLIRSQAQAQGEQRMLGSSPEAADIFLQQAMMGTVTEYGSPGLGRDWRVAGHDGVSGSALVYEGRVLHVGLFAKEGST